MRAKLIYAGLVLFGILALAAPVVRAQGMRSGTNIFVSDGETVTSTLWAAGSTIDVAGTVEGDVYCAGQNITISGTVEGDVLCAGQNITISGTVTGDVRAAGQALSITGTVNGSVSLAGSTVALSTASVVGRDASIAGNEVTLAGKIGRDAYLGNERSVISGLVGRNIAAQVSRLRLEGTADIGGRLDYTSPNDASIDAEAQVRGDISHAIPSDSARTASSQSANRMFGVLTAIFLFVVALAVILIAPQFVDASARKMIREPLRTFAVGAIYLFFAPILGIGLLVSVIGIPLALLALCLWFVVVMLSGPLFGYTLARLLWRSQDNAILVMLFGCLILLTAYLIPVLQVFMFLAALVFGSGMALQSLLRGLKRPAYRVAAHKVE